MREEKLRDAAAKALEFLRYNMSEDDHFGECPARNPEERAPLEFFDEDLNPDWEKVKAWEEENCECQVKVMKELKDALALA